MTSYIIQIKRLLGQIGSGPTPPYFAEFEVEPDFKIEINEYSGLALFYIIQDKDSTQRLATIWRSHEFYIRDCERFTFAIKSSRPVKEGFMSHFAPQIKPFWKRVPWYTLFLGVGTALGTIQLIGNHYDWLFDAPNLALKWNKSHIALTEGSEFIETTSLISNLPIPHRNLHLVGRLIDEKSLNRLELPLNISPDSIAQIAGSANQELSVSGVSPNHGEYEMAIDVDVKGGRLRSVRTFHFTRPVTVWPRNPIGKLTVGRIQDQMAVLRGELVIGPSGPNGLNCELEFHRIDGLRYDEIFDFSNLHKSPQWSNNNSPGNEVAQLKWIVLPIGSNTKIPFQLAVSRVGHTDWKKVAESGAIRCYYRQEKTRD